MSEKKLATAEEVAVEDSYHEIISADQEQTKTRAQSLAILPDEAKKNIALASQYSGYFPNPITKPFMRKYILAKLEFPTKGSELSQSITELNVRVDNLFNDAYMFEKAKLESEQLSLEMEELNEELSKEAKDAIEAGTLDQVKLSIEDRKVMNKMKLKNLEMGNKKHSLKKIELAAMARYNEAMGWKGCVEDILKEMGKTSVEEVDFTLIRMEEMAAKIEKWGELHRQGALELTPSKFQAIESNKEAFVRGIQKAQHQIEVQEEAQRLLAGSGGNKS